MKKFNPAMFTGYIYILVAVIILIVVFQIMRRTGLIKSKEQRKRSKESQELKTEKKFIAQTLNSSDLFKPITFQSVSKTRLLPEETARQKAKDIKRAFGFLNDDEEQIYGVFRSLTDKIQVSQISFYYLAKYNSDMVGDLIDSLNKKELLTVWNIVQNI